MPRIIKQIQHRVKVTREALKDRSQENWMQKLDNWHLSTKKALIK
jgi:hypothetical protein